MKLDFIPLLISFAVLSFIAGVHSQGKARKAPLEGSGSGLGPGVDDEDRGSQLPAGGSLLKPKPAKKKPSRRPPPISPSDRNRWTSPQAPTSRSSSGNGGGGGGGVLPESGRWPGASKTRNPPFRAAPPTPPRQQQQQQQQLQQRRQQQQQQGVTNLQSQLPQQGDEGSGNGGVGGSRLGGEAPPDQERAPQRPKLPPRVRPDTLPTGPRKAPQMTEIPIPCKEAQLRGVRTHYYYPRCDAAGRYERRQCNKDDCMCVSPDTGIVLEKTVALQEKNISCDEVRYIVQLPLQRALSPYDDHSVIQSKVLALLESLLDNLPGQQRLEFQRYLPNRSSPISGLEVLCRSVGHSDPSALARFLTTQAAKGSLPLVAATRSVNVTRLTSAPAVKDTGSLGNSAREQYNAAKDTPADETDPNAPRNDESQSGPRKKKTGAAAFLQQPGIIAAIIGGGIAGFFLAILLILFCIYRIRKKDEGSYALEEPKKMPVSAAVYHSAPTREYYA